MMERDFIRVLCFYKYWAREGGSTKEYSDGIMIRVSRLTHVHDEFIKRMRLHVERWGCFWVGPRPAAYELSGWVSESGKIERVNSNTY